MNGRKVINSQRFIGASAQGNAYKYAYYVCFSRHRYGTQECDQDRLRGDELEYPLPSCGSHVS